VNCLVWIQLVLAESFAEEPRDRELCMDAVRYFEGVPAFGMRKHFVDHWISVEWEPIDAALPVEGLPTASAEVTLDFEHFKRSHRYPGELYREDLTRHRFRYATGPALVDWAREQPDCLYLMFGVAGRAYLERYGARSGPMGQVHGMFLDVHEDGRRCMVHHASTKLGRVASLDLSQYVDRMQAIYDGYAVYRLLEAWDYRRRSAVSAAAERVLEKERRIDGSRASRAL